MLQNDIPLDMIWFSTYRYDEQGTPKRMVQALLLGFFK